MKVPDSELQALIELESSATETMHSLLLSSSEVQDLMEVELPRTGNDKRVRDLIELADEIEERIDETEEQLEDLQQLIDIVMDGQWLPSEFDILDGFTPLEETEEP
jgi:hypothetical protein